MLKKIITWTIYAGIVALLIFGAVIRTEAKTGESVFPLNASLDGNDTHQDTLEAGEIFKSSEGSGRNSDSSGEGEEIRQAENEEHDWVSLEGIVISLDSESLRIEKHDGEILEIEGRAWRFIQEAGFQLLDGDQVTLVGFFENGEFEVAEIRDLTSGLDLQIRDDSGRPLWSGGAGH